MDKYDFWLPSTEYIDHNFKSTVKNLEKIIKKSTECLFRNISVEIKKQTISPSPIIQFNHCDVDKLIDPDGEQQYLIYNKCDFDYVFETLKSKYGKHCIIGNNERWTFTYNKKDLDENNYTEWGRYYRKMFYNSFLKNIESEEKYITMIFSYDFPKEDSKKFIKELKEKFNLDAIIRSNSTHIEINLEDAKKLDLNFLI